MSSQSYSAEDIFRLRHDALILLNGKQMKVSEYNLEGEEKEETKTVELVEYIIRAVGNEMLEKWGETEESVKKSLDESKMGLSDFAYAKDGKGLAIYKNPFLI